MPYSTATLSPAIPPMPGQAKPGVALRAVPAPVPEESEILADAARRALELISADAALMLSRDGGSTRLRVSARAGLDVDGAASLGERVASDLAGRALREQLPVRSTDVAGSEGASWLNAGAAGIVVALAVPLRGGAGVLAVGRRSERQFSDAEGNVLRLVAENASVAMENLQLQADQQTATKELERQNAAMVLVREAHEQLVRASLHGERPDEIVAVLSRLVGASLVLIDPLGTPIAAAGSEDVDLESRFQRCRSEAAFGRALADLIDGADQSQAAMGQGPAAWRMLPVVAAGDVLGVVVILDAPVLSEADLSILEEGRAVLGAELLRERSVLDHEVRLHGGLLEALMGAGDSESVETRAALLGIDLNGARCVVAISPGSDALELPVAIAAGQRACARIGVHGIFGQFGHAIVALLVSGDRSVSQDVVLEWSEAFETQLVQRGIAAPAAVGVSPVPVERGHLRDGVAGAQQALRVGQTCRPGQVTFLHDVELLAVFADSMRHEQLKRYVDRCIGELLAYDARTNSQLVRTLEIYLDHSCVARHAAAALFLHPHSLRYRLRRIEEVQDLDLQDPFARLTAHLATKVRPLFDAPAHVS